MEDRERTARQDFIGSAVRMADADASPVAMFVLTLVPVFMLVPVATIVAISIRKRGFMVVGVREKTNKRHLSSSPHC